jgi:hypothetical protein
MENTSPTFTVFIAPRILARADGIHVDDKSAILNLLFFVESSSVAKFYVEAKPDSDPNICNMKFEWLNKSAVESISKKDIDIEPVLIPGAFDFKVKVKIESGGLSVISYSDVELNRSTIKAPEWYLDSVAALNKPEESKTTIVKNPSAPWVNFPDYLFNSIKEGFKRISKEKDTKLLKQYENELSQFATMSLLSGKRIRLGTAAIDENLIKINNSAVGTYWHIQTHQIGERDFERLVSIQFLSGGSVLMDTQSVDAITIDSIEVMLDGALVQNIALTPDAFFNLETMQNSLRDAIDGNMAVVNFLNAFEDLDDGIEVIPVPFELHDGISRGTVVPSNHFPFYFSQKPISIIEELQESTSATPAPNLLMSLRSPDSSAQFPQSLGVLQAALAVELRLIFVKTDIINSNSLNTYALEPLPGFEIAFRALRDAVRWDMSSKVFSVWGYRIIDGYPDGEHFGPVASLPRYNIEAISASISSFDPFVDGIKGDELPSVFLNISFKGRPEIPETISSFTVYLVPLSPASWQCAVEIPSVDTAVKLSFSALPDYSELASGWIKNWIFPNTLITVEKAGAHDLLDFLNRCIDLSIVDLDNPAPNIYAPKVYLPTQKKLRFGSDWFGIEHLLKLTLKDEQSDPDFMNPLQGFTKVVPFVRLGSLAPDRAFPLIAPDEILLPIVEDERKIGTKERVYRIRANFEGADNLENADSNKKISTDSADRIRKQRARALLLQNPPTRAQEIAQRYAIAAKGDSYFTYFQLEDDHLQRIGFASGALERVTPMTITSPIKSIPPSNKTATVVAGGTGADSEAVLPVIYFGKRFVRPGHISLNLFLSPSSFHFKTDTSKIDPKRQMVISEIAYSESIKIVPVLLSFQTNRKNSDEQFFKNHVIQTSPDLSLDRFKNLKIGLEKLADCLKKECERLSVAVQNGHGQDLQDEDDICIGGVNFEIEIDLSFDEVKIFRGLALTILIDRAEIAKPKMRWVPLSHDTNFGVWGTTRSFLAFSEADATAFNFPNASKVYSNSFFSEIQIRSQRTDLFIPFYQPITVKTSAELAAAVSMESVLSSLGVKPYDELTKSLVEAAIFLDDASAETLGSKFLGLRPDGFLKSLPFALARKPIASEFVFNVSEPELLLDSVCEILALYADGRHMIFDPKFEVLPTATQLEFFKALAKIFRPISAATLNALNTDVFKLHGYSERVVQMLTRHFLRYPLAATKKQVHLALPIIQLDIDRNLTSIDPTVLELVGNVVSMEIELTGEESSGTKKIVRSFNASASYFWHPPLYQDPDTAKPTLPFSPSALAPGASYNFVSKSNDPQVPVISPRVKLNYLGDDGFTVANSVEIFSLDEPKNPSDAVIRVPALTDNIGKPTALAISNSRPNLLTTKYYDTWDLSIKFWFKLPTAIDHSGLVKDRDCFVIASPIDKLLAKQNLAKNESDIEITETLLDVKTTANEKLNRLSKIKDDLFSQYVGKLSTKLQDAFNKPMGSRLEDVSLLIVKNALPGWTGKPNQNAVNYSPLIPTSIRIDEMKPKFNDEISLQITMEMSVLGKEAFDLWHLRDSTIISKDFNSEFEQFESITLDPDVMFKAVVDRDLSKVPVATMQAQTSASSVGSKSLEVVALVRHCYSDLVWGVTPKPGTEPDEHYSPLFGHGEVTLKFYRMTPEKMELNSLGEPTWTYTDTLNDEGRSVIRIVLITPKDGFPDEPGKPKQSINIDDGSGLYSVDIIVREKVSGSMSGPILMYLRDRRIQFEWIT